MNRKFLTLMAVVFATAALAQEGQSAPDYGDFTIDAQVRARGEYRGILNAGDNGSNLFVNDRVRLSFGWERKNLSMKVAAQHTGLWQDNGQKSTMGNIALHEAWAKIMFGKGFFAQAGRQELSYDDERLLGAHDWAASGRAHDALRLGWENTQHKVHAIVSFNQTMDAWDEMVSPSSSSSGLKPYKNMQALWYHFGRDEAPFQISALFLNQGVSDASGNGVNYMQTFGTYASFEKKRLSANASFYYQLGRDRTGTDVSAFLLSGNIGWQFSSKWKAMIGDDYLSGSKWAGGSTQTFNTLYGSYHEFFGTMDCFGYGSIPRYGLNDLNACAQFKANSKLDMSLSCHWFVTTSPIKDYLKDYRDPNNHILYPAKLLTAEEVEHWWPLNGGNHRFSQNLGTELDLQVNARPWKNVSIQAGYSMMCGTETMQLIKGTDTSGLQHFGWVSFNLNPTIFSTSHRNRKTL